MALTDEEIDQITDAQWGESARYLHPAYRAYARAIEAAATAPLLERIAELEAINAKQCETHNAMVIQGARDAERIAELEADANKCGSGAGCLYKDARIAALTAQVEHLKATASANYGRGHADAHSMQADQSEQPLGMVEQAAQPVAWMVYWGIGEMRPAYPAYNTRDLAEYAASQIKSVTEVRPLYTAPPKAVPLTVPEVEQILARWSYELHGDRARYIVRETEQAHGITPATVEKEWEL